MPRFFHLADLHLGRVFHGESLLEDQAHVLAQVKDICSSHPPDAIVLAGDLFDRSLPPVEAMTLLDDFLVDLASSGIPIIAIPGNHDSSGRLGYASRAWERIGVHLRADYARLNEPFSVTGRDGEKIDFFALPFVETEALRWTLRGGVRAGRTSMSDASKVVKSPESSINSGGGDAIDAYSGSKIDLVRAVVDEMRSLVSSERHSVLIAHEFVSGAQESGSERLYVGNSQSLPSELFEGFDYVALGHMHSAQKAGGQHIRYSGSPLPLSFDEARQAKGFLEVILKQTPQPEVIFHALTPLRPLHILEDSLENLLKLTKYQAARNCYVSARVSDKLSHMNILGRLRERFPYLRELRQLSLESPASSANNALGAAPSSAAETTEMVFEDFLRRAGWEDGDDCVLAHALLKEALTTLDSADENHVPPREPAL